MLIAKIESFSAGNQVSRNVARLEDIYKMARAQNVHVTVTEVKETAQVTPLPTKTLANLTYPLYGGAFQKSLPPSQLTAKAEQQDSAGGILLYY